MSARQLLLLVDGNALMHRAYHAVPPMTTANGETVNAVYGFTSTLFSAFEQLDPTHVVVMFDAPGGSFRNELDDTYKANRPKGADELYDQFPRAKRVVRALNLPMMQIPGYEADDVIGTLSKTAGMPNIILTGDHDALQLVDNDTSVFTFKRGVKESILYDEEAVKNKYDGLSPVQLKDYKGLAGDSSDNIPGVPGVGKKTATQLLLAFGSLEGIYVFLQETSDEEILAEKRIKPSVLKNLRAYKEQAFHCRTIGTIVTDMKDVPFSAHDAQLSAYDRSDVVKLFQEYAFKSLLGRLPSTSVGTEGFDDVAASLAGAGKTSRAASGAHTDAKAPFGASHISGDVHNTHAAFSLREACARRAVLYQRVDAAGFTAFLDRLRAQAVVAIDTETTSKDPLDAQLVGMSFSWTKGEAWYVPAEVIVENPIAFDQRELHTKGTLYQLNYGTLRKELRDWLADANKKKVLQNAKYDLKVLRRYSASLGGLQFDTMIASYLLAANNRQHGLDYLAFTEFGYEMMSYEDLVGTGKKALSVHEVDPDKLTFYACEDADYTWRLYELFQQRLQEVQQEQESIDVDLFGGTVRRSWDMQELFSHIEMPLVELLGHMEEWGLQFDAEYMASLEQETARELQRLTDALYQHAGSRDFNINSTQQLSKVLFEDLGLSTQKIKKTKTGYSTAASELEKLRGAHPIIEVIESYRELAKLQSTYITALPQLVHPITGRIHTSLNQTVAATGRLSSNDPNLQNIPIRTELGRRVRGAFVASEGYTLVAADYSQIDLRVLAHMCGDTEMQRVFQDNEDIHTSTAAKMFSVPMEDVSTDQRRAAKEINFGIVYGMGANKLASILGVSRAEAKTFIETYLATYPGLTDWKERIKTFAYEHGYVETAFGRRRYVKELASGNPMVQAAAERIAGNMPIQGTTADIVKLAMLRVSEALQADGHEDVRMLLQVHDDVLFEVPNDKRTHVIQIIQEEMESVTSLDVPLIVDIAAGARWNELKPL